MPNPDTEYYARIKSRMMKEFHRMFRGAEQSLAEYFEKEKIRQLQERSIKEYQDLFSELPYLGGLKSSSTINLITGAIFLSLIVPLEQEGLKTEEIGKVIYDSYQGYFYAKPKVLRFLIGKAAASRFFMDSMKKQIDQSQLRTYEEDFVLETVAPEGRAFDFGYNYTECAIQKLFSAKGKMAYLPYVCLGDHVLFKSYGIGFSRTQTIGNGAPVCDFRFRKNAGTLSGWPPEMLEEWGRRAGRTTPE